MLLSKPCSLLLMTLPGTSTFGFCLQQYYGEITHRYSDQESFLTISIKQPTNELAQQCIIQDIFEIAGFCKTSVLYYLYLSFMLYLYM